MWLACSILSPVPFLGTSLYSFHTLQKELPHPLQETNCPVNNTEARARTSLACALRQTAISSGDTSITSHGGRIARVASPPLGDRCASPRSRDQHQGQRQRPPLCPAGNRELFVSLRMYGHIYTYILAKRVRKANKIFYK